MPASCMITAKDRRSNGEQVEALMDLTSWAFNGVAPDHPQFEVRLAAWTAQVAPASRQRAAA